MSERTLSPSGEPVESSEQLAARHPALARPTAHLHALDEHGGELLRPLRVRGRLLREAQELPGGQPGVDAGGDGGEQGLCVLAPGGRSRHAQWGGAAGWVCCGGPPPLWLLLFQLVAHLSLAPLGQPFGVSIISVPPS